MTAKRDRTPHDLPAEIHHMTYGCSDKVNAPENQSKEFQAGYKVGMACDDRHASIHAEWLRRGSPTIPSPAFKEWKRGLWAASFQKIFAK